MKKLIAVSLILVLLLPVCAFASESDYIGCWAHYDLQTSGAPSMSMLYIAENHTCYFVIQSFKPDEAWIGRTYVGTWEILDDGTLYAKAGNNTDTKLTIYGSGGLAVNKETYDVFVNITPFTLY